MPPHTTAATQAVTAAAHPRSQDASERPGPLRIAIIASIRHPIREPYDGGLESLTAALAQRLRARGHDVTLFAAAGSDPDLGVAPLRVDASGLDLSRHALEDPSMVSRAFLTEHHAYLSVLLDLRERDVDLVHNHSLHYLPVAMAPTLPFPMVMTLHTPPTPWLESALTVAEGPGPVAVAVSEATAGQWAHVLPGTRTIPNGVDLGRWRPTQAPVPGRAVWYGRIVPEKGTLEAVAAARRAGMDLVVAGPTPNPDYARRVLRNLEERGGVYAGHLTSAELVRLVGSAEVALATPRWEEPFGLTVVEALACGTPVAGFARGALPSLLTPETGVLVPPGDVGALAEAIPRAAGLQRSACRRRATAFSLDVTVDAYERLYGDVLATSA